MAYSYRQADPFNTTGLYVDYNITSSVKFGGSIFANDTITLDCAVFSRSSPVTAVRVTWIKNMYYVTGVQGSVSGCLFPKDVVNSTTVNVSAAANTTKAFTMTLRVPNVARGAQIEYYSNGTTRTTTTLGNATQVMLWFEVVTAADPYGTYLGTSATNNTWYYVAERCSPRITAFNMVRSTNGAADDEGQKILYTIKIKLADTARKSNMHVYLYWAENNTPTTSSSNYDWTSKIDTFIQGVSNDGSVNTDNWSNGSSWGVMLWFGDQYESTYVRLVVPRSFTNMHLSGAPTGGVAFGKYSKATNNSPFFECVYPAEFSGGIKGGISYDSGEIDTGAKWINGKKIYRYVCTGTTTSTGTIDTGKTLPRAPGNIINISGAVKDDDGIWRMLTYASYGNLNQMVSAAVNANNKVTLFVGSAVTGTKTYNIVVEYTAT